MSQETCMVSIVRSARAALGWSQPDLAKRSGVSLVAIARLESGMAVPRLSTVSKLKEAFNKAGIRILDDQPEGGFSLVIGVDAVQESERKIAERRDTKQPN